jgi:hypothetical protein
MGFLDKARDLVGENKDKIRQGIDMAEKQARKYVPAQHSSKLAKAADMAHKGVDKVEAPAATRTEAPGHSEEPADVTDRPGGDTGE